MRRCIAVITAALLSTAAGKGFAQSVRGTVVDNSDRALGGIVVLLVDATSKEVARTLTNDRGDYHLTAPRPGSYRLRTMRIGFRAIVTDPIELAAGGEVVQRLVLANVAFALDTVRAQGRNACRVVARDSTSTIFAVWEQVRNALLATQLSLGNRAIVATTMGYDQMIDIVRNRVGSQSADVRSDFLRQPWRSLSADSLRKVGYVSTQQGDIRTYDAPGIDVLLSDEFLGDHCLRIAEKSDTARLGIAFEPTSDRSKIAEIKGTLWLDRRSAELRRLEYKYVNVSRDEERSSGGELSFARLKNGMWAISRWNIRMPTIVLVPVYEGLRVVSQEQRVDSIKVTGGELVAVVTPSGNRRDTLWTRPPVTLSGVVLDSLSGDPVANAIVSIPATRQSDSTNAKGRFAIDNMLPGRYLLEIRTPSLDSAGMVHQAGVVFTDSSTAIRVKVPSAASIAGAVCPSTNIASKNGSEGIIVGTVIVTGDSVPRPNVPVVARWMNYSVTPAVDSQPRNLPTRTDETGTYRLCGVPTGAAVTIVATVDRNTSSSRKVKLGKDQRFGRLDFTIDPPKVVAAPATPSAAADSAPKRLSAFSGTVADTMKSPLADAEVSLPELGLSTRTNASGAFIIKGLIPGSHKILVRRVGYGQLESSLDFTAGATVDRKIVLTRLTILDSVLTMGKSVRDPGMEAFEEHRRMGLGHFVTSDEIRRREGGALVSSMLRQMPRMKVSNSNNGYEYALGTNGGSSACTGIGGHPMPTIIRNSPEGRCLMREGIYYVPDAGEKMAGTNCYAKVYLDHQLMNPGTPNPGIPLRDLPVLTSIEAMEWYAGMTQVPPEYVGGNTSCGVLVVHTRRFQPKGPATVTFTGTVVDATGAPIVDAEVALPDLGLTAHTDRRGRFRVEGVTEVAAKVIARRVGYDAIEMQIDFTGGKNVDRQLTLKRVPGVDTVTVASVRPPSSR